MVPALGYTQPRPEGNGLPGPPPHGRMMGPRHHHPMGEWARRLNLSEEQIARLRGLREAYLQDTLNWRNERLVRRYHLRNLLRDPNAEPAKILAKQKEISELEAKIQERKVLYQLQMREVLTPEQIQLLPPGSPPDGFESPWMMPGRVPRRER